MKMKKYFKANFMAAVVLLWVWAVPAFSQNSFTLEQAIDYALLHSQNIKLSDADIAIADGQVKEYVASGIPQISGNANYTYFLAIPTQILPDFLGPAVDGRLLNYELIDPEQVIPPTGGGLAAQFGLKNSVSVGAEASFMIFDPAFFSGLKAINKVKDLAKKQKNQTEFDIRQNVTQAYAFVAFTKTNKEFLSKNIENLKKTLFETKSLFENGFVEELDVDRLELSLQTLEVELEKLNRMTDVSVNILKFQMNFPLEESIVLADDINKLLEKLKPGNEELGLAAYNYQNRPEYQTILAGRTLNETQIENIRSGYYPSLRGILSYSSQLFRNDLFNRNENGWFPNSFVGAGLSVPIYDGGRRKAQISQAKLELEKVDVQLKMFEYGMDLEIKNARENLSNAQATANAREKNLKLAERIYNVTLTKYKEGVGSTVETSMAERELYNAQSAFTEALFDVLNASLDLKKATGNLQTNN